MGGSAFSSLPDAPYTPRMPTLVYRHMTAACHAALREIFVCVATPIEGPGKTDHGDIDILVALERRLVFPQAYDDTTPRTPQELMAAVKARLGVEYAIVHPTGESASLAIPWPRDMDDCLMVDDESSSGGDHEETKSKYIQVDVRICPDVDQLYWILFKHAHGDIWNLLGSTIRPFGLTVDEEALWIRIPEIENFDRKKAKVCLTRDPVDILHFLGMKVEGLWSEPFESVEALFDYATTCRLFWDREARDDDADMDTDEPGLVGGRDGRKKLRANDRRRMKGRPIYRRWINEFIPSLHAQGKFVRKGPGTSVEEVRAAVRDEAFARFFVEPEYKRRLREWRLKKDNEQTKSLIKELIPNNPENPDYQFRACLVSAMKKIIMEGDASFGIGPTNLRSADGFYNMQVIREFVRGNWEAVGKFAWDRQVQRAAEAMRLKAASRKVGEEAEQQVDEEMAKEQAIRLLPS